MAGKGQVVKPLLVSCVCPTADRRRYIPQVLQSFLSQTYPAKELVILDDGDEEIADLIPDHPSIRYVKKSPRMNIPAKRNALARLAKGEIICHFDDDDWSAPDRVAEQVRHLRQFPAAGLVGFRSFLFWDEVAQAGYRYLGAPYYASGTSFCYRRGFWVQSPFPEHIDLSSDNAVVYRAARQKEVMTFEGAGLLVARLHGSHSNPKTINSAQYKPVPRDRFPEGFVQWMKKP